MIRLQTLAILFNSRNQIFERICVRMHFPPLSDLSDCSGYTFVVTSRKLESFPIEKCRTRVEKPHRFHFQCQRRVGIKELFGRARWIEKRCTSREREGRREEYHAASEWFSFVFLSSIFQVKKRTLNRSQRHILTALGTNYRQLVSLIAFIIEHKTSDNEIQSQWTTSLTQSSETRSGAPCAFASWADLANRR